MRRSVHFEQRAWCVLSALAVAAALASCDQVLGIEQASLDPDAGDAGSTTCESYCRLVTSNCTADNAQYGDLQTCLAVCAVMPEGAPGDMNVNTVQCRLKMAQSAPAEPESFCTAAGPAGEFPGGGNACGTPCESFCTLMTGFCSGSDAEPAYPDFDTCKEACSALPDLGSFSLAPDGGTASGPAVQCRIYHATAASQLASLHCAHALGEAPCN